MTRHLLIGLICALTTASPLSVRAAPPDVTASPVRLSAQSGSTTAVSAAVIDAHAELAAALSANNIDTLVSLYRDDARSLIDQQPVLYGKAQITSWHQAMQARRQVTRYTPATREVFDFGDTLLEYGTFTMAWRLADGTSEEESGKFLHVWTVEPGGRLLLKADVRNWLRPLPTQGGFFVALPQIHAPPVPDGALTAELEALNAINADSVMTHSTRRIDLYADDAIIMPHSVTAKSGMTEIRPFLIQYIDNGRGATFDSVKVWTEGFEDLGQGHVLEYFKFEVVWRAGQDTGTVSGGGIRLWRREPGGKLKMLREIGTHDYRS